MTCHVKMVICVCQLRDFSVSAFVHSRPIGQPFPDSLMTILSHVAQISPDKNVNFPCTTAAFTPLERRRVSRNVTVGHKQHSGALSLTG